MKHSKLVKYMVDNDHLNPGSLGVYKIGLLDITVKSVIQKDRHLFATTIESRFRFWNPLTWIYFFIAIPFIFIVCLSPDYCSFKEAVESLFETETHIVYSKEDFYA